MNLLLLLGAAFVLLVVGTLLGRYYAPDRRSLQRAAEEGQAYVRGLVEVLEGHEDKAISALVGALQQNTRTVEAYFALGTLFRHRGEHERAVRVHQAILVRRDIDKQTSVRVHHQLALDFQAAGFPRRAVKALELVVTLDKKAAEPLRELAALYETTGEWDRAAAAHRRAGKLGGADTRPLEAHMLAEAASRAMEAGEWDVARKALKRALAAAGDSVHALHVLALYHQRKGNDTAASGAWQKALRLAPDLAGHFVPLLERALFNLGRLEVIDQLLEELLGRHPGHVALRLAHARFDAKRNPERALTELGRILDDAPNLVPAWREKARLVLEAGDPDRIRQTFEETLGLLAKADRGFRCGRCGHTAEQVFWRCPACAVWDSARVAWGRRAGEGAAAA